MKYTFDVQNQTRFAKTKLINSKILQKTKRLMKALKFHPESIIEINFVTIAEIKKLNNKFLGKNRPTDVLSFANPLPQFIPFIGTIFICPAFIQKNNNFDMQTAVSSLIFHGIMHLSGKTHQRKDEINKWNNIFKKLKIVK